MLSKEEKEALSEYYQDKELYDPAKAPEQQTSDFAERCMCGGGHVVGMCDGGMSYAHGGKVAPMKVAGPQKGPIMLSDGGDPASTPGPDGLMQDSGNDPFGVSDSPQYITSDQQRTMAAQNLAKNQAMKDAVAAPKVAAPKVATQTPPMPSMDTQMDTTMQDDQVSMPKVSVPSGNKLSPDQYDQLIKALSAKPSFGQSAMSALAGLADAIGTGVARSANPGFQKNIQDVNKERNEQLINALRAKYESGLGNARLQEDIRSHLANEKETEKARQLTKQAQANEMAKARAELGQQQTKTIDEENKAAIEEGQKSSGLMNQLANFFNAGAPGPNPAILARAQGKTGNSQQANPKAVRVTPSGIKYTVSQ